MAERKIYSCDWCHVDSPRGDTIGDGWVTLDNRPPQHLCGPCNEARRNAIEDARKRRFAETRTPLQVSGSQKP
jgi:hypothetical protein